MTTAIAKLAERFALGNASEATEILKATVFKGPATDAQMTALCVVAQQYGLNPFTRELYAFPTATTALFRWSALTAGRGSSTTTRNLTAWTSNRDEESCTCTIYRKDRTHPIVVTEYMAECKRDVAPWKSHPRRMLRHKAMIQCARLAFGFAGIYDQDEAERIAEAAPIEGTARRVTEAPALLVLSDELFGNRRSRSRERLRIVLPHGGKPSAKTTAPR